LKSCDWRAVKLSTRDASEKIRIFLVDDQALVRRGLKMRLGVEPDFEVVGEAENGRILDQVEALSPDVVLMDVSMPEMDGIQATAALTASSSRAAVVMLSLYDDARVVGRAFAAGAVGFVAKDDPEGELAAAIRRAAQGVRKSTSQREIL
jgi:DNA-binding NarL/FixJ family response regulator